MKTPRALGALSLLLASGAHAAIPAVRPASVTAPAKAFVQEGPWRGDELATFTRSRMDLQPWADQGMRDMFKLAIMGERFSPEERAILDAFNAGLPITNLEAEVLTSRLLYRKHIAGEEVTPEQSSLLERYRTFALTNRALIGERNAILNGAVGRKVLPPEDGRLWELYADPELFNQLDGGQRVLEARFGKKGGTTRLYLRTPDGFEGMFDPIMPLVIEKPSAALAALVTPLVNNRTADATAQDTQSETSLVLGAGGKILASFNDSGSYIGGAQKFTGYSRSTDSGGTWTDQGVLPNSTGGDAGDPVFARSSTTGTVVLATLEFAALNSLRIFRMDDDGVALGSNPQADGAAGSGQHDKEWVTCDNFAGSGQGNFYMFWRNFSSTNPGMTFTRSTDDGVTWTNRQVLHTSGQGGWVTVGADHAVYVFYFRTTAPRSIAVRKSTDQGVTFAPLVTTTLLTTTGTNGDLGLAGSFRTNAFPQVVAHPTDATQLYMVYNDKSAGDNGNIYFIKTADGGATWSAPIKVNTDAGTNDQWQPVLAITPDGTGLFVSWYDRRLDVGNQQFEVFARHATISGSTVTWSNDYRVSDGPSPVVIGQDPVINTTYMGDYDQAVADNSFYYRTWSDNRLSLLTHTNQPDVKFVKVAKAGPGAVVVPGTIALVTESCLPASGAVDPNETVTMSFPFTNGGTGATTNLVGTLLATGGVTSPSGPQTYGAVAVNGTASQNFTFKADSLACGATLTASVQMQDGATDLGTFTFPITLGALGAPTTATYSSNGISVNLPDNTTVDSTISVPDVGEITDVNVRVRLNHTFDADLRLTLIAPDGTQVPLSTNRGSSGDNFGSGSTDCAGTFTVFDDGAATAISAGTAPFAASFRPETPFSALNAKASNGTWTLRIADTATLDTGTLYCWQVELTRASRVCNPCVTADMSLTNTPSSTTVISGGTVTYTYVATNNGPDAVTNVAISTTTPAGTTFVSATSSGGGVITAPAVGGTGAVSAAFAASTAVAGTDTLTMTVAPDCSATVGTVIANSATVVADGTDTNPGNNAANAASVTVAGGIPALGIIPDVTANSGDTVTFTATGGGTCATLYQWYRVGYGPVPGATSPVLTLTAYPWLNGAQYVCYLTNMYGTTSTNHPTLTVLPAGFSLTGFSPAFGPVGATVTLYGTNFSGVSAVAFNGTAAAFTPVSSTVMTATVPAGATTGYISVTSPLGTAFTSSAFTVGLPTPAITSFSPMFGFRGGTVTLTGTNFTGATAVSFNGVAAASFTVVSDTKITARIPSGAGVGLISVTNPAGTGYSTSPFAAF